MSARNGYARSHLGAENNMHVPSLQHGDRVQYREALASLVEGTRYARRPNRSQRDQLVVASLEEGLFGLGIAAGMLHAAHVSGQSPAFADALLRLADSLMDQMDVTTSADSTDNVRSPSGV